MVSARLGGNACRFARSPGQGGVNGPNRIVNEAVGASPFELDPVAFARPNLDEKIGPIHGTAENLGIPFSFELRMLRRISLADSGCQAFEELAPGQSEVTPIGAEQGSLQLEAENAAMLAGVWVHDFPAVLVAFAGGQ